jgi:pilus assembly protein CpaE
MEGGSVDAVASVVVGLDPPELAEEVVDFLDRTGSVRVVATASDPQALARAIREREPNAVVGQPLLVRAAGNLNGSSFLALETAESVQAMRLALDAGARAFYVWPSEREDLARAAGGTLPVRRRATVKRALVVAVYGPRGGVGTTFLATHLAAAFARCGQATALVDVDPVFGDVSAALGAPPGARSIADIGPVAGELSEERLDDVLWRHPAGFGVLLSGGEAGSFEGSGGPQYAAALSALQAWRDVVVLHVPRALDEIALAALERSDRILVVVSPDVLAFRLAKRALDMLGSLGLTARCDVVMNRSRRAEVTPADAKRVFGRPALAVLPADRHAQAAQDRGKLLSPRGRIGRAAERLARTLLEGWGDAGA